MNIPNILTISRFLLTLGFVYYLLQGGFRATAMASALFAIAALTDFFDGYYARKHNLVTDLGKILDPIADKFLIIAAFSVFSYMGIINVFVTLFIAAREVAVTVSRILLMKRGQVVPAESIGKIKTGVQMTAISIILIMLMLKFAESPLLLEHLKPWWYGVKFFEIATMLITVVSGFMYFEKVNK